MDANRIREALLNIFNNAVQALAAHGTITVKTYAAEGYAVIEIIDTGPGIEEKTCLLSLIHSTRRSYQAQGLDLQSLKGL